MLSNHPAVPAVPGVDPSTVDAVAFDIGGVFVIRHGQVLREGMARAGFDLPEGPEPYHRAHHVAVRALSGLVAAGHEVSEHDRSLWSLWERSYLADLGVPQDRLDDAVEAAVAVLSGTQVEKVWRQVLTENVEGFHRIVASGMPVAIVSNNDGTAAQQLRDLGICQVGPGPLPAVSVVVDSELEGVAKPNPAIFRPALRVLGTDPARTLYVGDTVHADVRGATAAGMPVVQLDPYDLHAGFEHARVPHVGVLADLLLAGRWRSPGR